MLFATTIVLLAALSTNAQAANPFDEDAVWTEAYRLMMLGPCDEKLFPNTSEYDRVWTDYAAAVVYEWTRLDDTDPIVVNPTAIKDNGVCTRITYPGALYRSGASIWTRLSEDAATNGSVKNAVARANATANAFSAYQIKTDALIQEVQAAILELDQAIATNSTDIVTLRAKLQTLTSKMSENEAALASFRSYMFGATGDSANPQPGSLVARVEGRLATLEQNVLVLTARADQNDQTVADIQANQNRQIHGRVSLFAGGGLQSPELKDSVTGDMVRPAGIWDFGFDGAILGYPGHGNVLIGLGGFVGALPGPGIWGGPAVITGYSFTNLDLSLNGGYTFGGAAYKGSVDSGLVADRGWYGALKADYRLGEIAFLGVGVRGTKGLVEFPDEANMPNKVQNGWRVVGFGEIGVIFK
jgi:hypothetical protein